MGISIGGRNSNIKVYEIRNRDGSVAGTYSISRSRSLQNAQKKLKRLNYNFKVISSMIMRSKTSANASQAVIRARGNVAGLRKKLGTGEYDDKELESAILHAEQMVRVAKKRVKHLQQEERANPQGGDLPEEVEADREEEIYENFADMESQMEEISQEEQELMRQMEEQMQELLSKLDEGNWVDELSEELMAVNEEDMPPEELEKLKKKHRSEELKDIVEADMKYLKAKFDRLSREKQQLSGSSYNSSSNSSLGALTGVMLELGGTEMAVAAPEVPAAAEGAAVDTTV